MKTKYPKTVFIYVVCDYDNGGPLYAVAETLDDIPADQHKEIVATYTLKEQGKFEITVSIKRAALVGLR